MTREEAKTICETRALSGEPFTFADLVAHVSQKNGWADRLHGGGECFRVADGTIQRLRKRGLIKGIRAGRKTIWTIGEAAE